MTESYSKMPDFAHQAAKSRCVRPGKVPWCPDSLKIRGSKGPLGPLNAIAKCLWQILTLFCITMYYLGRGTLRLSTAERCFHHFSEGFRTLLSNALDLVHLNLIYQVKFREQ